MFGLIALN